MRPGSAGAFVPGAPVPMTAAPHPRPTRISTRSRLEPTSARRPPTSRPPSASRTPTTGSAAELRKVDRRPGRGHRRAPDRDLRARPLPARRRARPGQDAAGQHAGPLPLAVLQPHPVHAGPDARGHHRHRGHPGGHGRPASARSSSSRARSSPTSILADEINRTPPKTQAALLEAMQERQVTAGGETHDARPQPFFVLATQNPIEQEGTYPLPEAQLDRFMFNVKVDYPSAGRGAARSSSMTTEPMRGRARAGAHAARTSWSSRTSSAACPSRSTSCATCCGSSAPRASATDERARVRQASASPGAPGRARASS